MSYYAVNKMVGHTRNTALCALPHESEPDYEANKLFSRARRRGQWGRLCATLTRRSRCLHALAEVGAERTVSARSRAGTRTVPIDQIRGSEGRVNDFDRDFYPLQAHSKGSWLSVAAAREQGVTLPPVELIQVADVYFVRDGHHRISVARAVGQLDVEANVTVWQVNGP
jgi:hypothetical protein